jgi:CheY-like chemotaxis protein
LGYTKPIVALTANAFAGQAEMFLSCGFDDFVSKPIDIRQLNMTLNKLIRDRMPMDVIKAAREQKEYLYGKCNRHTLDSQLAEFFVRDAKKTARILESIYINKCHSEEDISMFIINVHAMKSALANIGETSLSTEAAKLEQAGRDRDQNVILSELPAFLEMLFGVIHKYETQEQNSEKDNEEDRLLLIEKLKEIKAASSVCNKKAAKDLLAEIRQKTWSAETNECLGTIAGYLLHSDFDEVIRIIEEQIQDI